MTLHPCQVAAPFQILNARDNIAWLFVPFDGAVKKVSLGLLPGNDNDGGDAVFDVTVNGVTLFPVEANRPKIVAGALTGFVSGLDFAATEGQLLFFHAKDIPAGGLQGPVMLQVTMDDGIAGGLTEEQVLALAPGGDLQGTLGDALVNGLRGRSVAGVPTPPSGYYVDNFNDNAFDEALWANYRSDSGAAVESAARLNFPVYPGSGGVVGVHSLAALDWRNRQFTVKLTVPAGAANDFYIGISDFPNIPGSACHAYAWYVNGPTMQLYTWRVDGAGSGNDLQTFIGPLNADEPIWLRIVVDSDAGNILWYLSTNGVDFVLATTLARPGAWPDISAYYFVIASTYGAAFYVDDYVTTVPLSGESLDAYHHFGLLWDNPNNRIGLFRIFGVIDIVGAAPSGPPPGLPAGKGWVACLGNTLYMWDGAVMHSQVF